ncbi:hypothetical protein ACERZ8_10440 [Tateyamaria armeniaca]|uniref:Uncharacterized protein n=1 Tax=Tateyamaria armeniaca TaxID=2518930 RepID=A0ABW8UW44_9RHOB
MFTYRKRSVIPENVQELARELGVSFQRKKVSAELVSAFRSALQNLPAESVPRGALEIREIAQMSIGYGHREPSGLGSSFLQALGLNHKNEDTFLRDHPDLGWLLMFHGSGYVRQAAMEALTTSPSCPFEVAAVVYRLNDWVGNVRTASTEYARRFLLTASAKTISESAFFLLPQVYHLSRWNDQALSVVQDSIYRTEVLDEMREQFLAPRSGKVGQSLRLILQRSDFDIHLEKLVLDARLPTVRAIATETLLMRRARWFVGYRREWVNKVYGMTRRTAEFETRDVEIDFGVADVLGAAARDKSSLVRRIAADFLISKREYLTAEMADLSDVLRNDKSSAVRSRIDFLDRAIASA